jgi:hypothetical protein
MTDLRAAAKEAWLWGVPLIEMAQQRSARAREGVAPNVYQHQRDLIGAGETGEARESFVTTPNNDTLYSQAWVDLSNGPVKLTVPATGDRYFSLALLDMYTNNFAILGTRTTGGEGGVFTLVGPGHAATEPGAISSPTNWVWSLARILVEGPDDLAAARQVQDGLEIEAPLTNGEIGDHATRHAPWSDYFASVQALMNESPPPATDGAQLRRMAAIVRPGGRFDASRFSPAEAEAIKAGIADAQAVLGEFRKTVRAADGWTLPALDIGVYNQNYLQRASVAIGGLGALPRQEAIYFSARGPGGAAGFDSARNWKLTFTGADLPPVDSFWSLSLYWRTADGQSYFAKNPIDRVAIGDRTPGLKRESDGGFTIWLTRTDPGGDASRNWLPTPATMDTFFLTMRAYFPRRDMLDGSYRLPKVTEI